MHLPVRQPGAPCNAAPWNRDFYLISSLLLSYVWVAMAGPIASERTAHQRLNSPAGGTNLPMSAWFPPNFHSFLTVRDPRAINKAGLIFILTQGLI
jgi:hypothetical protein